MKIRPMEIDDLDDVVGWISTDERILDGFRVPQEKRSEPMIRQLLLAGILAPNHHWLVAEDGEETVGVVAATNADPHGAFALVHMAVAPGNRGKGVWIAKKGIRYAQEELGLEALVAQVPEDHARALALDLKLGFEDTGLRTLVLRRNGDGNRA